MMIKGIAWFGMTVLALAVTGYACALLLAAQIPPAFAQAVFTQMPTVTVWHLAGSAIALAVGAFQVNARLRARFLRIHRWLGRLYVLAVVVGGAAGFALALRSFGGLVTHLGFGLLAIFWIASTLIAFRHVRAGDRNAHREWMMRSHALTLAAVTLRVYLPASEIAGISFEAAYQAISWLCWVPNLVVVEWVVRRNKKGAEAPFLPARSA